jgi:hypothetical protein
VDDSALILAVARQLRLPEIQDECLARIRWPVKISGTSGG